MDLKPCVIVHHGGEWMLNEDMSYMGGTVSIFDDPRKDFKTGIRYLGFDDKRCEPFLSFLLEFKAIHVYTEHEIGHTVHIVNSFGLGGGGGSFSDLLSEARTRIKEDTIQHKSYDDELEMLKRVEQSKGKHPNRYNSDSEGLTDAKSDDESDDDQDFGYLVAPETKKTKVSSTVGGDATLRHDSKFFVG
uniref:Uncharacterized protein n=1 Tax=Chenopodium quinoa TaxID=63459 RepID=A0A803LST3_CHEQI